MSHGNLAPIITFPAGGGLLRSHNPPAAPARRRSGSSRIEHLTREQLLGLLTEAKAVRERDWILFLISFWHGLRASEAVSLTPNHFADGYLTVQRLKGSLRTRQPLMTSDDPLLDERSALESWLRLRQGAQRLFPISRFEFYYLMRSHGLQAGLPRHLCHPHILKHTVAVLTLPGSGIENVRQHLGHKSIASTGAYLRVTDEAASQAVNRAFNITVQQN